MVEHLFRPLKIGAETLPNRVCFLGHRTNLAAGGRIGDRLVEYYRRRAAGGCGLIIVGEFSIHDGDWPWASMINAHGPDTVHDFRRLTEAIQAHGTAACARLCHHGFQSNGCISRREVWGPSAVADVAFGETAKVMELEDIAVVRDAFARAAERAREGGFSGVEIDMGPESLLRQFLSPMSNQREDEYGGSLENRMRLPLEVVESVRAAVGNDFTVGLRLCADEMFWGGIGPEESVEFARRFEQSGMVDFLDIAVGTYYNLHLVLASMHTPTKFAIEATAAITGAVAIPTIATTQIAFPALADEIVAQGQAAVAGVVRPLIADPDAPRKAQEGRLDDIRYCIRDNFCVGRVNQSKPLACIHNPEVGEEARAAAGRRPAAEPKNVMVIGAGPAGMEAARTAAVRGHRVKLYERAAETGGQVNIIRRRPGREAMAGIVAGLRRELKKAGVTLVTGTEVTPEIVRRENPDAVVVATGSQPICRPFPGDYGPPWVLNVWDAIVGRHPIGAKVLFIDQNGGHHATATVEMLADQGKKVDMVTSDLFVGIQLASIGDLYLSRQRLLQKGVTFTTDVMIDEIDAGTVRGREMYTNRTVLYEGYDTVILDVGNRADDQLYHRLKGQVAELLRVGDCVAPRGIDMAVYEGRRAGERL